MSDSTEPISSASFTCNFGTVRLDIPFSQQPSVQQFLDVPTSEGRRLLSDKLLRRFLTISECVIRQELAAERQALKELHLGYELWKALPSGADFHDRKPEDLEESRWVGLNKIGRMKLQLNGSTSTTMLQIVAQLISRCQEEALRRIDPKFLIDKSFYILIYGRRFSIMEIEKSGFQQDVGARSCVCSSGGFQPNSNDDCINIC